MFIFINVIILCVGLYLVIKGGGLFVDASVRLAESLRVPPIVIGGTIVSIATTTPELVVSTTASWMGDSGIALGNAFGSVIANIGLIVGIIALIAPVKVDTASFRNRATWMFAVMVLVIVFSWSLQMSRIAAFVLVILAVAYLAVDFWNIKHSKKTKPSQATSTASETMSVKRAVVSFLIGAVLVVVGSRLLVKSGVAIATVLQIPSMVIGLTVIAVGTSLPELVTAIISSRKGVADLSIGNIVGANILNLSMITGVAGVIQPLTLTAVTRNYSCIWMVIMVLAMIAIFWRKGSAGRPQGLVLLSLYAIYFIGVIYFTLQKMALQV